MGWIIIPPLAMSSPKCFHTETVKTSLHKDSPPNSYIKQSLSLSLINKTLLETAAYLKTTICSPTEDNAIICHKDKQCHLFNPLEFKDITHKLLREHATSFIATPIYQWREKFLTIPTENQTPLFFTRKQIKDTFSACCHQIQVGNLPPTETPQQLGIYRYTLLPYTEFHKSYNSTVICRNNDYKYETHKLRTLHDKTIQTFNTMNILQKGLHTKSQNNTLRNKREFLDMFVDAGQRLSAIENQLTAMTETFRHNIEIENNFNRELYQTEKTLINKDNEISHEIYTIKFGLIFLSFQHHSKLHDTTKFNEITKHLETLYNLLRFYINVIMTHDTTDFYCDTNALQTDTPTCIQLRESYIHTTDTTLEAELAVHDLKLSPTILTTCELEYSQGNLHIPVIHNTYNTKTQDSTKTREIQPTDIFLLHDDFIVVQLLQNNKYAFSCYPPNSLYLNNAKYECSQQATLFLAQQLNSFSLQLHGQNLLKQAKIISDTLTTHLPRHQISPQNLTLPPDLMNTITEMFINKDTLPIFHPGTYKLNTLGIIGICLIIVLIIGIFTGIKICCCPHMDITQLCCKWKQTQQISNPKQQEKSRKKKKKKSEMKTMKRPPKHYKDIKYSARNQQTTLQPDFDTTQ